jgi:hypothetical protein
MRPGITVQKLTSGTSLIGSLVGQTAPCSTKQSGCGFLIEDAKRMEMILEDIERAIASRFHYLAVMISLTLPGICAASAAS